MKKLIVLLLAAMMLLALCACGAEEPAVEEPAEAPVEEPAEEPVEEAAPAADFEPVTFEFDEGTVKVVGAEAFIDSDDADAIRIYYDYTNLTDEPTNAWWDFNFSAVQAGFELVSTYASYEDDVPEYGNDSLDVYPGVTIRCIEEYSYNPEAGGVVTFAVDNYDDEYSVDFDVANLPGRPAEDLVIETISDPTLTEGLPTEGEADDYALSIGDAEVVDGWEDASVIRVYFNYTNNGEEATSCWFDTTIYAYQDGVQLETEWAEDEVAEDDAYSEDVEPGNSIYCSECWELRSDSPVEIYVNDSWAELEIGACFPVA